MDFKAWFRKTLEHEGGFVNDPDDQGGATNHGITQQSYSEFIGRSVTIDEIETMSLQQAEEFYLQLFGSLGMANIPNSCQRGYSDAAVNLGKGGASRVVQMACNTKLNPGNKDNWIDVDGAIGSGSRAAIADSGLSYWDWYAELAVWYANLVLKGCGFGNERTTQHKFQRGWFRRMHQNLVQDRLAEMSIEELEQVIEQKRADIEQD